MKFAALAATILTSLALSSCDGLSAPGLGSPPFVGPNSGEEAQKEAYRQGFGFGRRDAQLGKQANYMLYNNYYNSSTKKDFANGYMHGYRKHRR